MEDIPQPNPEPYSPGDVVRIYLDPDDADAQFHGKDVEILDVYEDSLNLDTGRELDKYSYKVCDVSTGEVVQVQFRHRDLVPING